MLRNSKCDSVQQAKRFWKKQPEEAAETNQVQWKKVSSTLERQSLSEVKMEAEVQQTVRHLQSMLASRHLQNLGRRSTAENKAPAAGLLSSRCLQMFLKEDTSNVNKNLFLFPF